MTGLHAGLEADDIDFSTIVRTGDTVMWSQGAAEPVGLVRRLMAQRHRIGRFNVFLGGSYSASVLPEHTDVVTVIGMGAVGSNRGLAGKMHVVPCHLSQLPQLLASGAIPVDVVLSQYSRPDENGRHSFGVANGYVRYALPRARVAIGEISAGAPVTRSRLSADPGECGLLLHSEAAPVDVAAADISESDAAIARNIARYVEDGSVLQIGIGSVPNALLATIGDRRRLGLHAGVVGDPVVDLLKSGAMDNSTKQADRGKAVTNALAGTSRLYRFADRNDAILIEPVHYTHAHATLAGIKGLVAINSAVEVDLTGQAGSEIAAGRYVGTIGGQVDFVRGALAAEGGRSIIGLSSRTARGERRIVPLVSSGVVTVPRADADIVVTEFGTAELRGQSISERVRRMIAIAHPADREQLERAARELVVGFFE
jgi:acyl-CoA hydrolase